MPAVAINSITMGLGLIEAKLLSQNDQCCKRKN